MELDASPRSEPLLGGEFEPMPVPVTGPQWQAGYAERLVFIVIVLGR